MTKQRTVLDMVHGVLADTDRMLKQAAQGAPQNPAPPPGFEKLAAQEDFVDLEEMLKVAATCDYLAENLTEIVDDRSPHEKLAEHFAIHEQLMAKLGGEEVAPAVPVEGVESALRREAADAPGESLDAGESGEATPAHQTPKVTAPGEKVIPADAGNAMPTNAEMMMPEQPEDVLKQANIIGILQKVGAAIPQSLAKEAAQVRKIVRSNPVGRVKQAAARGFIPASLAAGLLKRASDLDNPASNEAGSNPVLQSAPGVPNVMSQGSEAGENTPRQTAPSSGEGGGRELVGSNDAAINATKGQALKSTHAALSEVLTEPAMSAAHDKVLQESLVNTPNAGVKIAAARAMLKKFAAESPENAYLVQELLAKEAQGMGTAVPGVMPGAAEQQQAAMVPPQAGAAMPMDQGAGAPQPGAGGAANVDAALALLQGQQGAPQQGGQMAGAAGPGMPAPAPGQMPAGQMPMGQMA